MTHETNLLISEFMGGKEYVHKAHFPDWMREEAELIGIEDLRFHESWDWLMPVVLRIGWQYEISRGKLDKMYYALVGDHSGMSADPILATYEAVVKAVEHINREIDNQLGRMTTTIEPDNITVFVKDE